MRQLAKKAVSIAAYHLRLWPLLYAILRILRRKLLVVFTFHRITERDSVKQFVLEYDRGLDRELFEVQLKGIAKNFNVVNLHEFLDVLVEGKEPKGHCALITFDDADADFVPIALPLLEKYSCPGVMFVATDYIETEKRFWHLRVSNIFLNLDHEKWERFLKVGEGLLEEIARSSGAAVELDERCRRELCRRVFRELQGMDHEKIESVVGALEKVVGADYRLGIHCLSWKELREIQGRGIEVESHSVTHRRLAELDREAIRRELADSRSVVEQRLDKRVRSFCYPSGSFNELAARLAEEAGYSVAFTTRPGVCRYPSSDRFRVHRFTIDGKDRYSTDLFLGRIALRSLLGRDKKRA